MSVLPSLHSYIDLFILRTFLGALGLLINQRHILLSVICIERRFYGLNLFLVVLALLLDDRQGVVRARFILTLAAAESALALALVRAYFQLYGSILLREE
jgi:NADH-quinone oxidoreductase subunit K